jgi:hypothetical protein
MSTSKSMYYHYYNKFGSLVVVVVMSALITAGVLYAYFSHPLPALKRKGWRQCYGHRYG